MRFGKPTDIELTWADFIKAGNAEARESLNARRQAKAARSLAPKRKPLPRGAQILNKIHVSSSLVYGQPPLGH